MLELFWYVVRIRMKRLLIGLFAVGLMAQVPSVLFEREPPPRVPTNRISAQVTGVGGTQTYFYWVVVTYPVGDAFPGGPIRVNDVADVLAGGNFVTVRWPLMAGALSYDVLRTTTAQYPSGVANVLVAGVVAGPAQVDNTNVVGAYTLASVAKADGFFRLNNQAYAQPEFEMQPGLNIFGNLTVTGVITIGTFTPGSVLFANALGNIAEDNPNFFWDDVNNRLGVGTNAPVQMVDIEHGHLEMGQVVAPGALTTAVGGAGGLAGNYYYRVSYLTGLGETETGVVSALVAPAGNEVELTNIPVSADAAVTSRNVYRTMAGGLNIQMQLLVTIADNITTVYTDNIADVGLGVAESRVNTTGGVFYVNNVRRGIADDATTAWGVAALRVNTGYNNSAVGMNALYSTTLGGDNSALGTDALYSNTIGYYNSALGRSSMYSNTIGEHNSAFGSNALYNSTAGNRNSALGRNAGYGGGGDYTASNNVIMGYEAGYNIQTGGSNNIIIGYQAALNLTTGNDNIFIVYGTNAPAVGTSNFMNLGNVVFADLANFATGIGPLNITPTGTLDVLDRTGVTGETLVQVGYDGVNTSALSTSLTITAGTVQGAVNLQEWQDNAGALLSRVSNVGIVYHPGSILFTAFTAYSAQIASGLDMRSTYPLRWSSGAAYSNAKDLGVVRNDIETLEINDGTAGIANFADVRQRDLETSDVSVLGTQNLAFPADFSNAVWALAGEFAVVGTDAVYTFAGGGAGTVTQIVANQAIVAITGNRWYELQYTITGSTVAGETFTITNSYANVALVLDASDGAYIYYFEAAAAPANFVLDIAGATGGAFTLEDSSLQQIQGGDMIARGVVELNNITFADLPASNNGSMIYCQDCTIASPCAAGGAGAVAKRIGGIWVCN